MTKLTSDDYANNARDGVGRCPCCLSPIVMALDSSDFVSDEIHQACQCEACGATWNEVYQIVGFTNLEQREQVE